MTRYKWQMKRGDTAPPLRAQLLRNGVPVQLSGTTVMLNFSGNKNPCTIVDAENGIIEYRWQVGDTSVTGVYRAEIEVTYSDGGVETFPNNDYIEITIFESVD